MKRAFRLLWSFLRMQWVTYSMYLAFSAVFAVIFYLYSLPIEPLLYSLALILFIIIIVETIRFLRFSKKHYILSKLKDDAQVSISELCESNNVIEEDYQNIIKALDKKKNNLISQNDASLSEMQDYYSMWAHQIKTPISAMNLLIQNTECVINDELLEQLFRIEQYVDMVMQYLRADNMANDVVLEECSLDNIVKSAVRKYRKQFIRRKLTLNLDTLNCTVLTDEKWLQFVIEQIISNSLKYTHNGSVSIYMDPSIPKTLVIEDTGIGIRGEDLPRIFENGFTGYNGRADKKSTGIGLYLCKKILTRMSHKITVSSEIDKGTTVRIGLNRKKRIFE